MYASLAHPGVNVDGKTVRSPVDAICCVPEDNLPMIAVHHTTGKRDDLGRKWLSDKKPIGDLVKTAKIAADERTHRPNLQVTLVLTTNKEPREDLIRKVHAVGHDHGVKIDLWSCSRLTHFFDHTPTGQWLRRFYLNIEQELLSAELLHELSKKSISLPVNRPMGNAEAWISRELDSKLSDSLRRDVTFLVAESGMGKSVACYRRLAAHVEAGGFGIVLPHDLIVSAISLEQAVAAALRQLHPSLAEIGNSALSFCSPEKPLVLVVEDINRSGQAQLLTEKLVKWGNTSTSEKSCSPAWHLICPLWPEVLLSLGEEVKKRIQPLLITAYRFSKDEGREAVLCRAKLAGHNLSALAADEVAKALGYDPLLIALHDHNTEPDVQQVIGRFVEGVLERVAAETRDYTSTDFRYTLRKLAGEILRQRLIELRWQDVSSWTHLQGGAFPKSR